ncbi:6-hydroxymethylpterin diphosphokinase MptE-like protein [Pseudoalteromonas sp. SS15]|uniref:motility associated factor glycosyltransferase family protein n=1 Tax=Pseudoalteromonas sp. SS15 TaxID=3139393 RepID=UPI003BA8A321
MNSEFADINKLKLQATFFSNLLLLKQVMPSLYNEFNGYTPTGDAISVAQDGSINLINNGQLVYPTCPEAFAKKQVEEFLNKPDYFRYQIGHQEDDVICFKHAALLKSIYNVRVDEVGNDVGNPANEARLDFVCMLGGGLGYQIDALFAEKDILNFMLFEPSKDTFFALLHCLELKPLFEHCTSKGGQFSIRIGGSADGFINEVSKLFFEQGHFNLSRVLFFTHYTSETILNTIKRMKEIGHRWSDGWGFMEDEIIGTTHTLSNLYSKFPVLKNKKQFHNPIKDKPVFICANGPSLDLAIDFLKENQDKVIIVSAGTALKALLVNDIKPDIHIEMERTAGLLDWVEVVERTENIKYNLSDLRIVALNTVYTGIFKKFKSACLLAKVNDAGGRLINALDEKIMFTYPDNSNPSVSNTALAVVGELGFKNIYLCGTDFGFISEDKHHSKHSIYFDEDFKHKDLVKNNMRSNLEVKGNFREKVLSTNLFDSSKGNIELYIQQNPELKVKNTSDGAFIRLTTPVRIQDIAIDDCLDSKDMHLEKLFKVAASTKQLSVELVNDRIEKINLNLKDVLEQLLLLTSQSFETREQLADAFTLQNKVLKALTNSDDGRVIYWIIQGSFRYFQAYIMTNSYYYHDLEKRAEFMNACIDAFHSHIDDVYREYMAFYNKPSHL